MLTMGTALRVVTDWIGDPARVLSYSTRFTKPVLVPDDDDGRRGRRSPAPLRPIDGDAARRSTIEAVCAGEKVLGAARVEVRPRLTERPRVVDDCSDGAARVPLGGSHHASARRPGPRLVTVELEQELVDTVRALDAAGEPVLVLGGGSNLVVADDGFDGTVVEVATRGVEADEDGCTGAIVRVEAGEDWDSFVAYAIDQEWSGVEMLSGIPGRVGASPIQNVGAYGGEVADTIQTVARWDRQTRQRATFPMAACGFGYRTSRFKAEPGRYLITRRHLPVPDGQPVRARSAMPSWPAPWASSSAPGRRPRGPRGGPGAAPAQGHGARRGRPRHLERRLVLHQPDPAAAAAARLPDGCAALATPGPDGATVKTSAAWLIEHAGFGRASATAAARLSAQAHPGADQPRDGVGRRPPRARAGDPRRRRGDVRHHSRARARAGRLPAVTCRAGEPPARRTASRSRSGPRSRAGRPGVWPCPGPVSGPRSRWRGTTATGGSRRTPLPDLGAGDVDYGFALDGAEPLADPRSRRQPYGRARLSRTYDPAAIAGRTRRWTGRQLAGGVIYELHVGTFTAEGTLTAAIEQLDHLVALGVDFVEIMPVNAFNGVRNWGYDGVLWYAVQEEYGGPAALPARSSTPAISAGSRWSRTSSTTTSARAGTTCPSSGRTCTPAARTPGASRSNLDGEDSDEVRRFIIENAQMWLRDYHVDALRLDAVHALTDTRATHLLEELAIETSALSVHLRRPLSLIAESDLNDPRLITRARRRRLRADRPVERRLPPRAVRRPDRRHQRLLRRLRLTRPRWPRCSSTASSTTERASSFRGRIHGNPIDTHRTPTWRLVVCADNHDQIGNRADGHRLSSVLDPDQLRHRRAGHAAQPVHPDDLHGRGVGGEHARGSSSPPTPSPSWPSSGAPAGPRSSRKMDWDLATVPDPQDPATFERSKLDWSELEQHAPRRAAGVSQTAVLRAAPGVCRLHRPAVRAGRGVGRRRRGHVVSSADRWCSW